jgi:hypothetical protein
MKFNFDWNYVASGAPYITLSTTAIAVNTTAASLIGEPNEVVIGFDKDNMIIGIKPYQSGEEVKSYKFRGRMKNGWIRMGCKDFIKNLSTLTKLSFNPARRYIANYDEEENLLYISVLVREKGKMLNEKTDI